MTHYTPEQIEEQRKQTETVEKLGGHGDYQLDYALLQYMKTGEIPTVDDYGQEINPDMAHGFVTEYKKIWTMYANMAKETK